MGRGNMGVADIEGDGGLFYRVTRTILAAVYRLLIPVKVTGVEHLPQSGPVILAANHLSFFDTVVLMFSVPRRTYFVGKAEYMHSWTTRRLFPAFGLIPIERAAARSAGRGRSVAPHRQQEPRLGPAPAWWAAQAGRHRPRRPAGLQGPGRA